MRCIWDRADPAADLSLPSACVQWNGVHGQIANVFMILHVQQWLHKTLCFYWALEHKSALSFAIKHVDSRNARPVRSLRYGWSRLSTSTFAWDEEPPWNSSLPSAKCQNQKSFYQFVTCSILWWQVANLHSSMHSANSLSPTTFCIAQLSGRNTADSFVHYKVKLKKTLLGWSCSFIFLWDPSASHGWTKMNWLMMPRHSTTYGVCSKPADAYSLCTPWCPWSIDKNHVCSTWPKKSTE